MSVAGGLSRAVDRAVVHRCDALQIFAKNASQWRGRLIPREEIREFRRKLRRSGIWPAVSHASYLINLATTDRALRHQSIAAMADEIDRAESLGLLGVVLHPGCYTAGNEADGLSLIADALLGLLYERRRGKTMILLEQTAGQGTALGATFEQLASIIAKMQDHRRVGVCLDTCHLIAAGYDIVSPEGYASTFKQFGRLVGFERLKAFHLNDSKSRSVAGSTVTSTSARDTSGSNRFVVSSTIGASAICRCCSKHPRAKAKHPDQSRSIRWMREI
jgi:deoxyribonuclease-4